MSNNIMGNNINLEYEKKKNIRLALGVASIGVFYYLVAIVSMAGTMKWQRLGDIVAGTVVIRKRIKKGIQS